jgi:PAS domain S-box-containing protein
MIGVRTVLTGVARLMSLRRLAAITVLICVFARPSVDRDCAWAQEFDRVRVLLLFSNDAILPANQILSDSIHATMEAGAPGRLEFFTEYLDLVRFPQADHELRMAEYLREKYAKTRFDLVFAVGPEALNFKVKYRDALALEAPLVFAGVRDESLRAVKLPANAAGVASRFDPLTTLELALRLQPDTQHVAVVTGASDFDKRWEEVARDKFRSRGEHLQMIYLSGLPIDELLRAVAQLPPHSVVIYLSVLEDRAGARFYARDVAKQVAGAANAPVYAVYDTFLGLGIVGGYMNTFEDTGKTAALIALRILAGDSPQVASLTVTQAANFLVDWRQLRRWGLSESNLPAGAIVRFKEPSLWDAYRAQIIALIAVLLVQTLLIAGLLVQARRRRRAEESLRDTEERMSLAAQSTNLGFWQLDVATYRIWATDTCRALLGLDPEGPLTQQSFTNACHPDDRRNATRICEEAVAQGKSYEQEYRVVRADGRVRWVLDRARTICDTAGKSLRMTGVVMDITDRKQAEEALRESEERYRNVVETQTEMICRYQPDTTLTFVNDAYCRYFERSRDQLVGTRFIELIPEPARGAFLRFLDSLISSPRTQTYEHEVLRPDGSIGWHQWFDHVIVDSNGRIVELQGIGRDITDLKHAELEAEERRKEVTHLTRVAILGELSGALAHELNQPLTAILSNAQAAQRLLTKTPVDLDEVREILSDIGSEDKRAGDVINRLRALMKKGEAKLLPLNLNDLANDVLGLAHSELIERNVAVATRLAPGLPDIRGDRVQLQQVLLNLVMNACEAMADNDGVDSGIEVSTARDGSSRLRLTVADRGPGIPPDLIDRIFEPFITTKSQGLGLGLSICHSIVAAHGGRLWAVNNPDRGASFLVSLPIHAGGQA